MLLFLITLARYLSATSILVFLFSGLNSINSLMIRRTCVFPFLGGINFSILSLKKSLRSYHCFETLKSNYRTQLGNKILFKLFVCPKSATGTHVHYQYYTQFTFFFKNFNKGVLNLAVTFQSIERISSPGYIREPLKTPYLDP